jgi:hypothetical protein
MVSRHADLVTQWSNVYMTPTTSAHVLFRLRRADASKRSGRALCKSCYCTALNAVYQSSKDAKATLSTVDAGDCVFRLWASMTINGTDTAAANDTAEYDTCQPYKALHLQCPAPQNSALHAVFYDEAKSLVAGQLPARKAASSAAANKDANGTTAAAAADAAAATCPLSAADYTASAEFKAAVRSSCGEFNRHGCLLLSSAADHTHQHTLPSCWSLLGLVFCFLCC